jgi:lipopolysaccharide export system protein LptA
MNIRLIFFLLVFCAALSANAQPVASSDSVTVEILNAERLRFEKKPDGSTVQILSGGVRLRQGTTLFSCDSCIVNESANMFEAFGKVHINDRNATNIYSNYLRYLLDIRYAYLRGAVRLTDNQGTLTTDELEYDVANRIGVYKNGGRVVNKNSVLTSKEGVYYADIKDIYFKTNVELKDPAYYLKSDSLLYNTETQVATFISKTFIRDSSNRTITTSEGYYDQRMGRSEFTKRTTIVDNDVSITGDEIANDDASGTAQVRGNAVLIDEKQGVSILANEIFANKKTEAYLATKKPLMIIRQEKDSIYVTADTLFTARLTDLFITPDSLKSDTNKVIKPGVTDSTNRYFEAFRNVRVFTDSVQAVSDSLFYSFKDSVFRLFDDPVVWSNKSQITGDTIFLHTKNKKADHVKVFENSLLINELESGVYNQVKSTRMDGFFTEGVIDSVRARGFAESIYFLQDNDSAYSGINESTSDVLDVYFVEGGLNKVVFRSAVKGTVWPITQKNPGEMRLQGFSWHEARRPKTKYDMFE